MHVFLDLNGRYKIKVECILSLSFAFAYSDHITFLLSFLPPTSCCCALLLRHSKSVRNIQRELIIILSCLCYVKQAQEGLLFLE